MLSIPSSKMAKGQKKRKPIQSVAVLRANPEAKCAFCNSNIDDEVKFGKIYTLGTITCHYYCVLLSSCLVQKGKDEEGLLGFLEFDLVNEIARGKKLRCNYCGLNGATLACCKSVCKRQFHLPCGKARGTISLFYGNYQSFCVDHGPKQNLPAELEAKVKARITYRTRTLKNESASKKNNPLQKSNVALKTTNGLDNETLENNIFEQVCPICYEDVAAFPSVDTLWPPCCRGDRWFHRNCVERMALSAARHYLKCPLCNDKSTFCNAVMNQGVYVPDRDASWELDQGAYSELHERTVRCNAHDCLCTDGRSHNVDETSWEVIYCASCGSEGRHIQCLDEDSKNLDPPMFRCADCLAVAVPVETIVKGLKIEADNSNSASNRNVRRVRRPVMPARMSLRRAMLTEHTPRQGRSRESTFSGSSNSTETSEKETFTEESVVNISVSNNYDLEDNFDIESINDVISENEKYGSVKIAPEILSKVKPCPKSKKHKFIRKMLNELIGKCTSSSEISPPIQQIMDEEGYEKKVKNQSGICDIPDIEKSAENFEKSAENIEKFVKNIEKSAGNMEKSSETVKKITKAIVKTQDNIDNISISSNESIDDLSVEKTCAKVRNISEAEKSCDFQCSYDHHSKDTEDNKSYLKSVIDFAIEAALKFSHERSKKEKICEKNQTSDNEKSVKSNDKPNSHQIIENPTLDNVGHNSKSDKLVHSSKFKNPMCNDEIIDLNNDERSSKSDDLNTNSVIDNSKTDKLNTNSVIDNSKSDKLNTNSVIDNSKTDKLKTNSVIDNSKSDKLTTNSVIDNSKSDKLNTNSVIDNSKSDKLNTNSVIDNSKSDKLNTNSVIDNSKSDELDTNSVIDNSKSDKCEHSRSDEHIAEPKTDNIDIISIIDYPNLDKRTCYKSDIHIDNPQTDNFIINSGIHNSKLGKRNYSKSNKHDIDDPKIDNLIINAEIDNSKLDKVDKNKLKNLIVDSQSDVLESKYNEDKEVDDSELDNFVDKSHEIPDESSPVFFLSTQSSNRRKHLLTVKTKIGNKNIIDRVEICESFSHHESEKLSEVFENNALHDKPESDDENSNLDNFKADFNNSKIDGIIEELELDSLHNYNLDRHLDNPESYNDEGTDNFNSDKLDNCKSYQGMNRSKYYKQKTDNPIIDPEMDNSRSDKDVDNANPDEVVHKSSPVFSLGTPSANEKRKHYLTVKTKIGNENIIDNVEIWEHFSRHDLRKLSQVEKTVEHSDGSKPDDLLHRPRSDKLVDSGLDDSENTDLTKKCTTRKSPRLTNEKLSDSENLGLEILEIDSKSRSCAKSERSQSDPVEIIRKKSLRTNSKAKNIKNKRKKRNSVVTTKEEYKKVKDSVVYVVLGNKKLEAENKRNFPTNLSCESKKPRMEENNSKNSNKIDVIKNQLEKLNEITVKKNLNEHKNCDFEPNVSKTKPKLVRNDGKHEKSNKLKEGFRTNGESNDNSLKMVYWKPKEKTNDFSTKYTSFSQTADKTEKNQPKLVYFKEKVRIDNNLCFLKSTNLHENEDLDEEEIFTPKKLSQNQSETKQFSKKCANTIDINTSDDDINMKSKKLSQNKSETRKKLYENSSNSSKNINHGIKKGNKSYKIQDSGDKISFVPNKLLSHEPETEKYLTGNTSSTQNRNEYNKKKTNKRKNMNKIDESEDEHIFTPKKIRRSENFIETIDLDSSEEKYKESNSSTENYETNVILNTNSENIHVKIRQNKREAFKLRINRQIEKTNLNKTIKSHSPRMINKKKLNSGKILVQTQLNLSPQNGFVRSPNCVLPKKKKKKVSERNKECNSNMKQTTIGSFFTVSP